MTRRQPHRGFTLVELLMTTTVSIMVLTGVVSTFVAQARQYQAHAARRGVQANARQALMVIEKQLRNAGYGVDPTRVFLAYDSYDAVTNAALANYPDAVTFHSRDKTFSRVGSVTTSNVNVTSPLTEVMRKGQILLIMCPGARVTAYVTVGQTALVGASSISLDTATYVESPVGMPGPRFHEQGRFTAPVGEDGCFNGTSLIVTQVDRFSYFLRAFDDDNNVNTPNVPYLMVHNGTDMDGNGAVQWQDASPVATGIEQLQIAYIMNTIDGTAPMLLGVNATPAAPAYGDAWATDVTSPAPSFDDAWNNAKRINRHPANIRQVRVTLVSRSASATEGRVGDDQFSPAAPSSVATNLPDGTVPWRQLENCTPAAGTSFYPNGGNYQRSVARISVAPKNLLMRSQFLPPQAPTASVGGGG